MGIINKIKNCFGCTNDRQSRYSGSNQYIGLRRDSSDRKSAVLSTHPVNIPPSIIDVQGSSASTSDNLENDRGPIAATTSDATSQAQGASASGRATRLSSLGGHTVSGRSTPQATTSLDKWLPVTASLGHYVAQTGK